VNELIVKTTLSRGELRVRGLWRADAVVHQDEMLELCLPLTTRISGRSRTMGEWSVFVKGGPFSRSGARRHRLRGIFLGAPPPALAEFRASIWLRERLFQSPEPLGALDVRSGSGPRKLMRPRAQIFVSAAVPGARSFEEAWPLASAHAQVALAEELGREVGRMHALHFLHADLYPRNVLVSPTAAATTTYPAPDPCVTPESLVAPGPPVASGPRAAYGNVRRLWFIDSWAGGATAWRQGSLRRLESDLGTWLADFQPSLAAGPLHDFLGAYAQARTDNGRPLGSWNRWLSDVVEARRSELRKLERQRYRLRGAAFPQAGISMPTPAALVTGRS
jgi:hypothetical protein